LTILNLPPPPTAPLKKTPPRWSGKETTIVECSLLPFGSSNWGVPFVLESILVGDRVNSILFKKKYYAAKILKNGSALKKSLRMYPCRILIHSWRWFKKSLRMDQHMVPVQPYELTERVIVCFSSLHLLLMSTTYCAAKM
jgi:hypothetical protein